MIAPCKSRFLAALFAVFTGLLARPADASVLAQLESEQRALFERVAPAVVYIASSEGIGSGFFVQPRLIVTNAHVVGTSSEVDVVIKAGARLRARVIARAPERVDLALLQVATPSAEVLKLSSSSLAKGDWVASVGHGVDSPWSFTTGMVSNIFKKQRRRPVFQTQIPLNPGNSGGPIVNHTGQVIGVVTSGISTSNSVNFAIHSDEIIKAFPEHLGATCACLRIEAPEGTPILVDGEYVGQGPLVLVPVDSGRHEVTATIRGRTRVQTLSYPATRRTKFR